MAPPAPAGTSSPGKLISAVPAAKLARFVAPLALLLAAAVTTSEAAAQPPARLHAAAVAKYRSTLRHRETRATRLGTLPARPHIPKSLAHGGRIPDLGVTEAPAGSLLARRRAKQATSAWQRAAKIQPFQDQNGYTFTMASDNDAVDLQPFANIFAATYHYAEIQDLRVLVTSNIGLAAQCGDGAEACYIPDDAERLNTGLMILSYEDPDIVHSIFHEYGHHIDNQLYNLGGLGGCNFSSDGSRRWFFERDVEDAILDQETCSPDGDWSQLLGELYAEDYAQLSSSAAGVPISPFDPRLPVLGPSSTVLEALKEDIDDPFVPTNNRFQGSFRHGLARRSLSLDVPSFLSLDGHAGARGVTVSGCDTDYTDVYEGNCRLRISAKGRSRRYRTVIEAY